MARLTILLGGMAAIAVVAAASEKRASDAGATAIANGSENATPVALADSIDTWKVQRAKVEEPEEPTFQFLTDNRDFFRARLDALLLVADRRALDARALDPRLLRWQEMMGEIRAATDSASAGADRIARAELLKSVAEIEGLEKEMDSMAALLAAQHGRLGWLEEDFTGRQRTALVVLLTGVPRTGAPRRVVVADADGPTYRVDVTDAARESLARGASTQVLHELVEPRAHRFAVTIEGNEGSASAPFEIPLEPARDALTFVEIDVAGWDPAAHVTPPVQTWTR